MGIYNALFTGASGLSSFGEAVRVIGDNIANVNSLGFKAQNVVFSDVLSQTVNVSRSNIANQVGNGVRIGQITRDAQQGSIQSTTNATDMAINGRGMFALKDPASGQTFFTRAGAFFLDKSFNLIDGQGFVVQGWQTDTTGAATGNVRDVTFANLAAQASATTKVDVGVSIDSNAIKPNSTFDPNNAATYNYKTDVSVFDSLGATHSVSLYFVKQGLDANGQTAWDWHTAVAGNELKGATAATPTTPVEIGGGIYDVNTPSIPQSTVLPVNTVFSSDSTTDQTITIPKGGITDQNGTSNIAAVTWTKNTTLGSVLSQAAAGSLAASGLYTLNKVITPSATSPTIVSAGNIYVAGQASIGNATTTIANQTLPSSLFAKNSNNGIKVNTNGIGSTLSADSLTQLGSGSITFPAGSLQDENGGINNAAITWAANTKLATAVTSANATMSKVGMYTLVGTGDILTASSGVTYATVGQAIPTLNTGATLTGATAIGGASPAQDLVIPAGSLRDSTGAINTAAITLPGGGAALNTLTAVAGLSATGPYTLLTSLTNTNSSAIAAGSITNQEAVFGTGGSGVVSSTFPVTLPTNLFTGTTLSGTTKVATANLVIPIGALKDNAGTTNTSAITLPAGGAQLDTLTAVAGLSATGPYTLKQSLTSGTSTLAAGTVTLKTELATGLVSIPPLSATATTGIAGVGPQSIVFDANGALVSEFSPQITLPWNGANANQISINLGSATSVDAQGTSGGKGLDGVVQLAGSFATRQMTRDGFTSGFLDKLETDSTGVIFGVFTNGQRRPLYQVALANFPNAQVLSHMGSNLQQETIASGTPVMEKPGNGGMGSISPFGLEQSNVDLAGEFVKLIIVQRGYEANSKTITTTDQMLGSLMQLKR